MDNPNPNSVEMGAYPFVSEAVLEEMEESVDTAFGSVKINVYGKKGKQAIVTFHDIGMNSTMNFENFFQFQTPAQVLKRFCVYNINAPGQEVGAKNLPASYVYPSMDGIAHIVEDVVKHFGIKSFIGFGIGAGANILLRYALNQPNKLDALILVNPTAQKAGWIEWFYQKTNLNYLKQGRVTQFSVDYFIWHHFGKHIDTCNQDILQQYRAYFYNLQTSRNLALFIESFISRNELTLRDAKSTSDYLLKVPTLLLVGDKSAFINESIYVNSQLDPKITEWLKVSDSCGLVLDDRPDEVTQAFLLFLQGIGLCTDLNVHRLVASLRGELQDIKPEALPICEQVNELIEARNT